MLMTVTSKGQATIPRALRQALGIARGDVLEVWQDGDLLVARRVHVQGSAPSPRQPHSRDVTPGPRRDPDRDFRLLKTLTEALESLLPHEEDLALGTAREAVLRERVIPVLARVDRVASEISVSYKQFAGPKHVWEPLAELEGGLHPEAAATWAARHLRFIRRSLRIYVNVASGLPPTAPPET